MSAGVDAQAARLLARLRRGPITALQGLEELGIARTASRVCELRKDGHEIQSEYVKVRDRYGSKCRVARYYLVKERA